MRTHLRLGFFSERVAARSGWPRSKILQVFHTRSMHAQCKKYCLNANGVSPDCPEREATYIITTGGINDPEKV